MFGSTDSLLSKIESMNLTMVKQFHLKWYMLLVQGAKSYISSKLFSAPCCTSLKRRTLFQSSPHSFARTCLQEERWVEFQEKDPV